MCPIFGHFLLIFQYYEGHFMLHMLILKKNLRDSVEKRKRKDWNETQAPFWMTVIDVHGGIQEQQWIRHARSIPVTVLCAWDVK